jgi:2-octaprenyl-6-methoxyphenol hydroxylase
MATDVDIAICGAGPVGLTLAALLVQRGMAPARIALIDAKSVDQALCDPRSIALSYGSRQILEEVQAWPLPAEAIHQIHVSRRGHFGRTLIDRADHALPALGYVTCYGALIHALSATCDRQGITVLRPIQVTSTAEDATGVALTCSHDHTVTAQIMVQAEGALSGNPIIGSLQRDYDQTAIVTQVRTSAPIAHRAFERFTEEGPLALLPQDDDYAVVWCVRPAHAEQLAALSDADFLTALERTFGSRLGRFLSASRRNLFPLKLNALSAASARTVAIGNAAQTLHPVAGQGLNLGLRDAVVLADLLAQETTPAMLERFISVRQADRNLTVRLTDGMARLFASAPDGAFSQILLGLSLGLIDILQPAKQVLTHQMMFGKR